MQKPRILVPRSLPRYEQQISTPWQEVLKLKVTLRDPEIVRKMLSRAIVLNSVDVEGYNKLYLSPDRSQDERISRQKLVQEMKERIKKDSSKKYYIRNNKVCVAE